MNVSSTVGIRSSNPSTTASHAPTAVVTARASGDAQTAGPALMAELGARLGGRLPHLLALFASTAQPLDALTAHARRAFPGATLIGASTSGEFTETEEGKGGVVAFALVGDFLVAAGIADGLCRDPGVAVAAATRGLDVVHATHPHSTSLVLLDPLAGRSEETMMLLTATLGDDVAIAGGAAGDDLKMKETFVALDDEVRTDAVVVVRIHSRKPIGLGVAHGHRALSGPLRVTRAEGALVHEIEGRPAWDVWRDETRVAAANVGLDVAALAPEQEGPFLLRFEAGLATGDGGLKIRAPLAREGNAIRFATEVPEGAIIRLTQSESEAQIASAGEAARRARASLGESPIAGALVFDCICRNLILGSDFVRAIRSMSAQLGGVPLAGFETYGEIAFTKDDRSGFHNTTSVVVAFPA